MGWNMRQWFGSIESSGERLAMPIVTSPGLALSGGTVSEASTRPEVQAACIVALARRYPSIAAMTMMDLSVEAEAFGAPIKMSESEVPSVSTNIVDDEISVERLETPHVGAGRTSVYLKAAELAAREIADRPVFAGQIGPFSLAGRLYDLTEILIAHLTHPESIRSLLEKCTEFLIEYARAYRAAGANGIIMAEPAAALLGPPACREFSMKYVKQIVDAVQDDEFGVILHNCGDTKHHVHCMVQSGAMGVSFGNAVEMPAVLPQIPAGTIAFGNLDPVGKFRLGSADDVRRCTKQLLEDTASAGNFVVSSGCDVPPGTPLANLDAFYEAIAEFNGARVTVAASS